MKAVPQWRHLVQISPMSSIFCPVLVPIPVPAPTLRRPVVKTPNLMLPVYWPVPFILTMKWKGWLWSQQPMVSKVNRLFSSASFSFLKRKKNEYCKIKCRSRLKGKSFFFFYNKRKTIIMRTDTQKLSITKHSF